MSNGHVRRRGMLGMLMAMAMVLALMPASAGAEEGAGVEIDDPDAISQVSLAIPNQTTLQAVVDGGFDLDHDLEKVGNGYTVTAIVTNTDIAELDSLGVGVAVESTTKELAAAHEEALDAILAAEDTDTVVIARADTFTNTNGSRSLSVEAKTSDGTSPANANPTMTLRWFDADDAQIGQTNMSAFVDAGQYMYHRTQANNLAVYPEWVSVTSANGGYAERDVEDWLGPIGSGPAHRYFSGFINQYSDALGYYGMIEDLAAQYPDLAEIIELPYLTNGYQRNAMALFGTANNNRVGVTTHAWGHEGGNDVSVALVDPAAANAPLSVAVAGNAITVTLATNAESALTSTAAEVVAAINANAAAAALVEAYTYRGSVGDGVVAAASQTLTDGLSAPEHVVRGPNRVKAIRIGKHRDGSKTGVFGYSAEHAREWQTPLVGVETAARLLHNYATDHKTKQIVDNMDIFILPVVNPDGELYSKYDFASQRKNMTNHCGIGENNDYGARNTWGVDNNRNYTAYSGADGYSGASTSCTSGTYRGPGELSEPESANVHWVMGAFPNIKFSMNIHSSGNYYMWSPGSYATPGRISAPRPSFGEENFFWYMADRILTQIKQHRGLTVTPARTGPIADVLYSAAGNSGDMAWYDFGVFGFSFETGTSFQPSFASGAGSEAWHQMMEFSNGLVDLIDTAMTWTRDRYAPTSWIHEDVSEPSAGPVGITFRTSEPADIYYTTDGSNPTTDSAKYDFAGIREQGETLWFEETTTIKWFSVDMAGNVEGKYDPRRNNAKTATIVITP